MKGSPKAKLAALKAALDEELNSTSTSLRNTFMNKIATAEDVRRTCEQLAEKLSGDHGSVQDAKIALVDLLDEALHGNQQQNDLFSLCKTEKITFLSNMCNLAIHVEIFYP